MGDAFAARGNDEADILTISAATPFGGTWLSARIGRFQLRYPDLAVRLSMSNAYVDFDASDVDVAIRIGPGGWPGLRADFLFRSPVTPICAPAFLEANPLTALPDLPHVQRLPPHDPWWARTPARAG